MSHFGGMLASSSRMASRIRRFMRFLLFDFPSALGVVNPTRGPAASWLDRKNAEKREPECREPLSYTRRKSLERRMRFFFGKENCLFVGVRVYFTWRRERRARRKPSASNGPWPGGGSIPAARPWMTCERESRVSWRAYDYSAEKYVLALFIGVSPMKTIEDRGRTTPVLTNPQKY